MSGQRPDMADTSLGSLPPAAIERLAWVLARLLLSAWQCRQAAQGGEPILPTADESSNGGGQQGAPLNERPASGTLGRQPATGQ